MPFSWDDYDQEYYPEYNDYSGYSYDDNYDFGGLPVDTPDYLEFLKQYSYNDPMETITMDSMRVPEPTFKDKVWNVLNQGTDATTKYLKDVGTGVGDSVRSNPLGALGALAGAGLSLAGMTQSVPRVRVPGMSETQKQLQQLIMQQAQTAGQEGDVATAYKQRVLKALAGDDTVDPTLLREQEEERRLMETRLLRELGPGYLTSGNDDRLGGKILNDLNKKQSEARFSNRRQILTQDEQSRQGAAGLDLQKKATAGNLALQGFSGLGDYARMGLQANIANTQADAARNSDLVRSGSQLLGYGLGTMKTSPFDQYWEKQLQKHTTKGY